MPTNRKRQSPAAALNGAEGPQHEEPLAFEEALGRLDEAVAALESGQLPLEDALLLFEEGMRLTRRCQEILDRAELRVQQLRVLTESDGAAGEDGFVLESFVLDDDE
jgi:exodeoxyribonuclease VII small subunit